MGSIDERDLFDAFTFALQVREERAAKLFLVDGGSFMVARGKRDPDRWCVDLQFG